MSWFGKSKRAVKRSCLAEPNAGGSFLAVVASKLTKQFAHETALSAVDFEIKPGELFAVIGPHGAGKSTLCNLVTGVSFPSGGAIEIFGSAAQEQKYDIGYLTQHFSLYADLSIDENIRFAAGIRGVSPIQFAERRERLLHLVGLEKFRTRLAGRLSGGMKQKLALCCALISTPQILVLDEPTTGLDPLSRREFWHILSQVASQGTTTLVTTPQFDEAELCQRVALMYKGRIHDIGTPKQLRSNLGAQCVQILTSSVVEVDRLIQESDRSAAAILDTQIYGDRLEILTQDASQTTQSLADSLKAFPERYTIEASEPTLEHAFLSRLKQEGFAQKNLALFPRQNTVPPDTIAIEARGLTKTFGQFTAVDGLSLQIKYGEIYGLLGANGAGKTTTIQMLSGLTDPSAGTFFIAGKELGSTSDAHRAKLGYMSQKFTLYDDLTISENLDFYAAAYSLPSHIRIERMDWVLNLCDLRDSIDRPVGSLSHGARQWLAFGAAVMHAPDVVILDEPTAGLDPLARRQLWKLIREMAGAGSAILVTTHFLNDAEYCNHLGLMVDGRMVAQGTPSELKRKDHSVFEVRTPDVHAAFEALARTVDVSLMSCFPGRLHVQSASSDQLVQKFAALLSEAHIEVSDIAPVASSLEDAFVSIMYTGRKK